MIAEAEGPAAENPERLRKLYPVKKELLATFLEKGAISKGQYEKSLYDLTEKMGTIINADSVSN